MTNLLEGRAKIQFILSSYVTFSLNSARISHVVFVSIRSWVLFHLPVLQNLLANIVLSSELVIIV